jgi:nitroimidazol reductase NimA-like FMN-containing flavoprotein (pyridoxamine 5'-phosphate oxidase superfamily)
MTWSQFLVAAPELATYGEHRLEHRIAYLATIRSDGSPRVHPVSPFIAHGHLLLYMEPTSPKGQDLHRDSRYAMHATVEDNSGGEGEFLVRGRAAEINDAETRAQAFEQARASGNNPQDRYVLFELRIAEAIATIYQDGQPKRTRWKAASPDV